MVQVVAPGMAWWTDIIFFRSRLEEKDARGQNEGGPFAALVRVVRRALYDNLIDAVHLGLLCVTYAYLVANIAAFFFQRFLPHPFVSLVETFSEPYLGALGIYIVVNEIRRRRGKNVHSYFTNIFVGAWLFFLIVSSLLVYFSEMYYFNAAYRIVVANSFAAFIIRLGTVLGRVP